MAIIQRLHRGIHPLDLPQNDKVAVGITLPFDGPAVFNSSFTTKQQIKSNLLNLLLTNPGERFMNPKFGIGIRKFLFENIISKEVLRQKIQDGIIKYIPEINLTNLVMGRESMDTTPEIHMFKIHIAYRVLRENSMDAVEVNFN
jgi:phage baseplate assembly protein W|tara:strand:+ start:219 stop:650 length:432 start_codon:yes stop_codon:yes gene_type:complete